STRLSQDACRGTLILQCLLYYASPTTQIKKIQNLTVVLRFLKEVEKIQLKGIAAGDILDGNTEQTLKLVWLLILHYHIDCRSQQHSSEPALQRKN
ncbi:Filamin-B, partial [Geodia barretti]